MMSLLEERRISYKFKESIEPHLCQNVQLEEGIAWNSNEYGNGSLRSLCVTSGHNPGPFLQRKHFHSLL